jgi:tRNA(Ile)-lysidine synthase TilS/MesJ
MKANYKINAGDISVIRPLVYCRESLMTEFAKSANLPIINENCPACFEEPKERARIKKLLSREETLYPNLYDHIRRALIPVMHDDSTAIMRSYLEETIAKSVKVSNRDKKKGSQLCSASKFALRKNENALQTEFPPDPSQDIRTNLASATEEQLTVELARRRAAKFHLSGAMKCLTSGDDDDPTGQVCTLNGGNGSIPCRELME